MMDLQGKPTTSHFGKSFFYLTGWFSVLIVALLFHVMNWGTDSLVIVPLKLSALTGVADEMGYQKLLKICERRQKFQCVVDAYKGLTRTNPQNLNNFLTLADIQRRMGQYSGALRAYDTYLNFGGQEIARAYYGRAMSLTAVGDPEGAVEAFQAAIRAKPGVIQVTITEAYLEYLLLNGNYKQAEAVISEARRRGRSQDFFAKHDEEIRRGLATN